MKFVRGAKLSLARLQSSGEELARLAWQTPLWGCGHTTMGQLRSGTARHFATPVNKATENINHSKSVLYLIKGYILFSPNHNTYDWS